jgi:hypothetical protein
LELDGKDKVVCESSNKPRYGQTLACFPLPFSGKLSLLLIISTQGATGNAVAVGTSAGVSEAAGTRVSVGILVKGIVNVAGGE